MLDTLRGPIEMEKLNPVTKKPQLYPNEEDLNTFEQFDIGVGRNKIIYSQQIDQLTDKHYSTLFAMAHMKLEDTL